MSRILTVMLHEKVVGGDYQRKRQREARLLLRGERNQHRVRGRPGLDVKLGNGMKTVGCQAR